MTDPLEELREMVDRGDAEMDIIEVKTDRVVNVEFPNESFLGREPSEIRAAVTEHRVVILEMVNAGREEWDSVLNRHGVFDDDRREQLRAFVDSYEE